MPDDPASATQRPGNAETEPDGKKKEKTSKKEKLERRITEIKKESEKIKDDRLKEKVEEEIEEVQELQKLQEAVQGTLLGVFLEAVSDRVDDVERVVKRAKEIESSGQKIPTDFLEKSPLNKQENKITTQFVDEIRGRGESFRSSLSDEQQEEIEELYDQAFQLSDEGKAEQALAKVEEAIAREAEEARKVREQEYQRLRNKDRKKQQAPITEEQKEEIATMVNKVRGKKIDKFSPENVEEIVKAGRIDLWEGLRRINEYRQGAEVPVDEFLHKVEMLSNEEDLALLAESDLDFLRNFARDFQQQAGIVSQHLGENETEEFGRIAGRGLRTLQNIIEQVQRREELSQAERQGRDVDEERRRWEQLMGRHREGGVSNEMFRYHLSEEEMKRLQLEPRKFFREKIVAAHNEPGDRKVHLANLHYARLYLEELYKKSEGVFKGLSAQEKDDIFEEITDLARDRTAFMHASSQASMGQSIEGRQKSAEYWGMEEIMRFEKDWTVKLFRSIIEHNDVAFSLMRVGDRITEANLEGSLENMRKFANTLLERAITAEDLPPEQEQMRQEFLENLFGEEIAYNKEKLEQLVGQPGTKDFGILEGEMRYFWDYYDWMLRIPGFDVFLQDNAWWLPTVGEKVTEKQGSPFTGGTYKLEAMLGAVLNTEPESRAELLKMINEGIQDWEEKIDELDKDPVGDINWSRFKDCSWKELKNRLYDELSKTDDHKDSSRAEIMRAAHSADAIRNRFFEYRRRAGKGSSGAKIISQRIAAEREGFDKVDKFAEIVERASHGNDFYSDFYARKLKGLKKEVIQEKVEEEIQNGANFDLEEETARRFKAWKKKSLYGTGDYFVGPLGEDLGVFLKEEGSGFVLQLPDDPTADEIWGKINQNLKIFTRFNQGWGHEKEGKIMDHHGHLSSAVAGWEAVEKFEEDPNKAIWEDRVLEELEAHAKSQHYQEAPNILDEPWDRVFEMLTGEPLYTSQLQKEVLDGYRLSLRNLPIPPQVKLEMLRNIRYNTYPDVDYDAPLYQRWWTRQKNKIRFARESLYVLGLWDKYAKRYGVEALLFAIGYIIAGSNVVLNDIEGIDDIDVSPWLDPMQILRA
jgi:hypothetical protein